MFSRLMSRIGAIVLAGLVALALGLGVSGSAAPATPCTVGERNYPNNGPVQIYTYDANGSHATTFTCNDGKWEGSTN
jgi:hypothetical protein